jgi:hypothetical protein
MKFRKKDDCCKNRKKSARQGEVFAIPKWQQEITLKRLKSSNSSDYIPWQKAKKFLSY